MTLSNIFFGKRVVQEAYLNNALIYKSKGWETLPSTCTEVWDKELEGNDFLLYMDTDVDGSLFLMYSNYIYKYSSDGIFLLKIPIIRPGLNNRFSHLKIADEGKSIYTVEESDIKNPSTGEYNHHIYIAKYNIYGVKISDFDIYDKNEKLFSNVSAFTLDDNYFYLSAYNYTDTGMHNFKLFKVNRNTFDVTGSDNLLANNQGYNNNNHTMVTDNGEYLYIGSDHRILKVNKNNLNSIKVLWNGTNNNNGNIIALALGNINLVFLTANVGIYSYNLNDNTYKTLVQSTPSNVLQIAPYIDYAENVYYGLVDGSSYHITKASSDNTFIYNMPISNFTYGGICGDNKGNMYFYTSTYMSSSSSYVRHIKKYLNLVKKGS